MTRPSKITCFLFKMAFPTRACLGCEGADFPRKWWEAGGITKMKVAQRRALNRRARTISEVLSCTDKILPSHTVGQQFIRLLSMMVTKFSFVVQIERQDGSMGPQSSGRSGLGRVSGVLGKMGKKEGHFPCFAGCLPGKTSDCS